MFKTSLARLKYAPKHCSDFSSISYNNRTCLSKVFLPVTKDHTAPKTIKDKREGSTVENGDAVKGESHQLMIRAGLIRQSSSGVYSLLPFALRSLEKIEKIIDQEMRIINAQKLSLPVLLSANTWKQTGRWNTTGSELFKLKDRKDSDFCLAPTHEEEITQLVANEVFSYRQLPLRLYQTGKKYRDEMRPRAGLLRGREFIMKDLYTFDVTEEVALKTYEEVFEAYKKIFTRIGLPFAVAEADTGNIGGTKSHEFHFLSPVGEDLILSCKRCGYTSNEECAHGILSLSPSPVSNLQVDQNPVIKLFVTKDRELSVIILGNGREMNAVKCKTRLPKNIIKTLQVNNQQKDIYDLLDTDVTSLDIFVDNTFMEKISSLEELLDNQFINKTLSPIIYKLQNSKSIKIHHGDFHNVTINDGCPICYKSSTTSGDPVNFHPLTSNRAIEVGHTFFLGTKYSESLKATFTPENPQYKGELLPIQMGCYGIGISRMIAAIIESSHDSKGIIWPPSVAPYRVCIIPGGDEPNIIEKTRSLYDFLTSECDGLNGEVLIDDRMNLSFGYRMKDAELIGYPWLMIIGKKYLESEKIEIHERHNNQRKYLSFDEIKESFYWV